MQVRKRAYKGKDLCRFFLDRMRELVIVEANMPKVDFKLVLLQKQIRAQLVTV